MNRHAYGASSHIAVTLRFQTTQVQKGKQDNLQTYFNVCYVVAPLMNSAKLALTHIHYLINLVP